MTKKIHENVSSRKHFTNKPEELVTNLTIETG